MNWRYAVKPKFEEGERERERDQRAWKRVRVSRDNRSHNNINDYYDEGPIY